MKAKFVEIVRKYFAGQNDGNADAITALFSDDAEVYNVNFPVARGRAGVKAFCDGLYARTSARQFECLTVLTNDDVALAEWRVRMSFRPGAKVGPLELQKGFDVELRGVNKFEFERQTGLIRVLRTYHETTTVGELVRANAKNT